MKIRVLTVSYNAEETIAETIVYDDTDEYRAEDEKMDISALIDAASLSADEIRDDIGGLKGMYLANPFLRQSPGMAELRKERGFKVMWEYTPDLECRTGIRDYLDACDIWSLNLPEAKELFGTGEETECIDDIRELGRPCFFRLGTKGAAMVLDGKIFFVPIVRVTDDEKDPTGCGNSSTAAAMWAYFEGYDPLMTTCIANTVAAYNAAQFGPVPLFTEELRKDIFKKAEQVYKEYRPYYFMSL